MKEAFDTNWVVPMGPNVNEFEKSLEEFVNGTTELGNHGTRDLFRNGGTVPVSDRI